MPNPQQLITENLNIWTAAIENKTTTGRGSNKKQHLYGIKKLRELILELAVRGLLVPQDPNDEPASVLLEKIAAEKEQLIKDGKIKKQKKLPEITDEEKPFELPKGWSWTNLKMISSIGPRNELDDSLEVGFVPMPMVSTSYDGSHDQETRTWGELKKGYTHFADGDIGIAKITPCFENSKAVIFRDLKNGFGAGTTELHIARPYLSTISREFILLYLKAPMFLAVGKTKMTGSAGQKRVPKSFFEGHPLPFPPEAEQPRIVAKVDELMALCDQLEQQTESSLSAHQTLVETLLNSLLETAQTYPGHATSQNQKTSDPFQHTWQRIWDNFDVLFTSESSIDQLKQTILQLAVMGKLVPQDPSDEPASILLEKIAAEKEKMIVRGELRKIRLQKSNVKHTLPFHVTEGSVWSTLGSTTLRIIDGNYGESYPSKSEFIDSGVPFLTAAAIGLNGDIVNGKVKYISAEKHSELKKAQSTKFDLLLTNRGARAGAVGILTGDQYVDCNIGPQVTSIRVSRQFLSPEYLLRYMQSPVFISLLNKLNSGSAMNFINLNKTMDIPVVLPPYEEQGRIVAKVDELLTLCDTLKERLRESQSTQLHLADAMAEQALNKEVSSG